VNRHELKPTRRLFGVALTGAALLGATALASAVSAETRVVIGATETISSHNPHGDSISMGYGIWCQVYGCLGTYSFAKGDYVGMLAERWEVDKKDPNVWLFHLRKGVKRQYDGKELAAEDVVHSINRMAKDPQTRQKQNVKHVKSASVVDKYTVKVVTKLPTAPLLEFLFDRVMVTSKDLFDKHGPRNADRKYPWGYGPYKLEELVIGERIVLRKDPASPWAKPENPDTVIFRVMREPEQRVTALLNNEIQIAQFIPPHLGGRVSSAPNANLVPTPSVEIMFFAMSPKWKPFDNRLARKAACMAIDRDAIIKAILGGQAERLDAPVGQGQYAYDPAAAARMKVPYDPKEARALLEKAGLIGAEIELETPVGRYVNDKQLTEAMIPMLNAVGFKAKLKTPEWPTLWANVQKGKTPFYYMGRGSVVDPSPAFAQYFETGGSPRIGFSNEEVDRLLRKERATFDPEERKKVINLAFAKIVEEQPACFMWKHNLLYGIAKNVTYTPNPTGKVWGSDMAVR